MAMFILSLELRSLRLVEFSTLERRVVIEREEIHVFSKAATHPQTLIQEIKEALEKIKKSWRLPHLPLHCILSSDFALLRTVTFEKAPRFLSISRLVQHDVEKFVPLPLEKVSVAYHEIASLGCRSVLYAVMKRNFLDEIISSIQEAGFSVQRLSLLPVSLCFLPLFEKTFLITLAERSINFFFLSGEKNLEKAYICPFSNFDNSFCEQETGLPLLLSASLKNGLKTFIDPKKFPTLCWILKTHDSEEKCHSISLFLKKELSISSIEVDPSMLLCQPSNWQPIRTFLNKILFLSQPHHFKKTPNSKYTWKRLFKVNRHHISPIHKFTAPSLAQLQRRERASLLIYLLFFLIALLSPLSLLNDYVENKKNTQNAFEKSLCLKQRELELRELQKNLAALSGSENEEKKFSKLQEAHNQWPQLINELQQSMPQSGIWITQLTPIISEGKEKTAFKQITTLEIKGLYLEGIKGEKLLNEYANRLNASSLFIVPQKEPPAFCCSKENGTAYAYPFTLQLQLRSPIQLL